MALPERSHGSAQRRPPSPPGSAAGPGSRRTRTAQSSPSSTPTRSALGTFGAAAAACAQELRTGLPLSSLAPGSGNLDKEIDLLLRRLAGHGLLEYRVGATAAERGSDRHRAAGSRLLAANAAARRWRHSRSIPVRVSCGAAAMRWCWSSPRAGALFRICDPKLASLARHAVGPAAGRTAQAAGRFSGGRGSRLAGGLPNRF